MKVVVTAVGMIGPGLTDWQSGQAALRGEIGFDPTAPLPKLAPTLLPANERRRTTSLIKLALQCAQDALGQDTATRQELAAVFACASGDLDVLDRILKALCLADKPVSPTDFHNSVHNAPAGYWSIACHSHAPSTSLSAFDASFVSGLLEAGALACVEARPVLLLAYDMPPPPTLSPCRPLLAPFALALRLEPEESVASSPLARLEIMPGTGQEEPDTMASEELEALRLGNPAARALPLLQRLARQSAGRVVLPGLDRQTLCVEVMPC